MIRRIYADLPDFKTFEFREGLNVVLAEKSKDATDKHTRNRAGKSSLLDVMHLLLGSQCRPESIFRNEALTGATFGMEFDLGGTFARAERSGSQHSIVRVASAALEHTTMGEAPNQDGFFAIRNDDWTSLLGKLMFGLDSFEGSWAPTFRSLIAYFIRRDRDGGMEQPMKSSNRQQLVNQQVNISFLLGLEWAVARDWQKVRDREKSLGQLRKSMNDGVFGSVIGSAAALKSELIVETDRATRLRDSIAAFRVIDEYHDLERELAALHTRLKELSNETFLERRYLTELEQTTVEEVPPAAADLELLYREAGVVLPELVKKRFDDVSAFHASVVKNRRAYLHGEIEATKRRIATHDVEKDKVDARRAEVMQILQSAGALEQFVALQGELAKVEAQVQTLAQKQQAAEALESGSLKLQVERVQLVERLRLGYTEQERTIADAVLTFRDIAKQLYETEPGSFSIETTDNGPVFEPHIPGEKSKGVNNMRIFCFDMMLAVLSMRRGRSPGFLVHDSHLFDGVDERQCGRALAVGAALAKKHKFQYIVTMNEDDVPREVPTGFAVQDYTLSQRLTDASQDGGLFGLRFD